MTTDKDFRIKNGLVVEGSTATINSNQILTTASSIDSLSDVNTQSATTGQVLTYSDGEWIPTTVAGVGGGGTMTVSSTAPLNPSVGDMWFDSTTTRKYIFYDGFWVEETAPVSTLGNLDGGFPDSDYGGMTLIDAGSL